LTVGFEDVLVFRRSAALSVMQKYRFHLFFAGYFSLAITLFCALPFILPLQMQSPVGRVLQLIAAYIDFIPVVLLAESRSLSVHIPFTAPILLVVVFVQCFVIGFGISFFFREQRKGNDVS
jgi:hypothetical protein